MTDLASDVRAIAALAADAARGTDQATAVDAVARRLDEPLRVAIAGRVKAGKSTLLNALVGERLAATDAGECTRIVTWYRHGLGYRVTADLRPTGRAELTFRREDGELHIDLGPHAVDEIERIEVGWPSAKLESMSLIDTPGLGSTDERTSMRTTASLLDAGVDSPAEADAVVYLMRHLHQGDARFLEAFMDHSIAHASPVNAVVVLSRADEIGAARPDALDSAEAIAGRYAADPRVRELASGVLPVAGLLAETGATLRQEQFDWLRALAKLGQADRDHLLTSVERFRDAERNPLGEEIREDLLGRFGLFGIRLAVQLIADGEIRSATELSAALLERSGIRALQRVLTEAFGDRAALLKARSALVALRAIAATLGRTGAAGSAEVATAIDRLEASSGALALLRLQHLVLAGQLELAEAERVEVERLWGGGDGTARVGLEVDASAQDVKAAALAGVERWRNRAGNPLSDRRMIEAAEIVSRAYEEIYTGAR
jgi:GTP-binding protein EngB required for normal cell division